MSDCLPYLQFVFTDSGDALIYNLGNCLYKLALATRKITIVAWVQHTTNPAKIKSYRIHGDNCFMLLDDGMMFYSNAAILANMLSAAKLAVVPAPAFFMLNLAYAQIGSMCPNLPPVLHDSAPIYEVAMGQKLREYRFDSIVCADGSILLAMLTKVTNAHNKLALLRFIPKGTCSEFEQLNILAQQRKVYELREDIYSLGFTADKTQLVTVTDTKVAAFDVSKLTLRVAALTASNSPEQQLLGFLSALEQSEAVPPTFASGHLPGERVKKRRRSESVSSEEGWRQGDDD